MANDDWDITKPIDHTKIGDVPGAIRDVTSSAKIIIAKEHVTPSTDNAGGQHLMGAVRVSLQSDTPTLDPEGNSLDTTATTDNGRLSIDTAASNELKVFVATSAGVSTSWDSVRVSRVKADEDLDANAFSVKNLASGTQAGEAIHIGQVDTRASTGQLKLLTPSTDAKIAVAVLDPPTEDGHIASKKFVVATPHTGGIVQTVNTQTGAVATGSTILPLDDTVPQSNEGDEYMTLAITPTNASNKLKIEVVVNVSNSASAARIQVALFKNADANALAGISARTEAAMLTPPTFTHYMAAGTTSTITFKVRIGGSASSTTTFNGFSGNRKLGGTLASSITITEIKV